MLSILMLKELSVNWLYTTHLAGRRHKSHVEGEGREGEEVSPLDGGVSE